MRKLLTFLIALAAVAFAVASVPASAQMTMGIIGGYPSQAGGGGAGITWAYKTNAVGGGGSSVTLSSVAIGPTVSTDIVVLIVANDAAVPTGVTIDGHSMTPVSGASDNTGVDSLTMWYLTGQTLGSTSTVVVSSGGTMFTVGAEVGVISGSSTPTPSSGTAAAASFSTLSIASTVPSGGIAIVGTGIGFASSVFTSATIDTTINRGGGANYDYMAHTALGTGASITATATTNGQQGHGVMGVWSP
jgi:hypothetical protein